MPAAAITITHMPYHDVATVCRDNNPLNRIPQKTGVFIMRMKTTPSFFTIKVYTTCYKECMMASYSRA